MPISGFYPWFHFHSILSHFWELRLWNSFPGPSLLLFLLACLHSYSHSLLHLTRFLLSVLHPDTHVHMVLLSHCIHTSTFLSPFLLFSLPSLFPHAMFSLYPILPLPLLKFQVTWAHYNLWSQVKLGSQTLRVFSLFPCWSASLVPTAVLPSFRWDVLSPSITSEPHLDFLTSRCFLLIQEET